MPRISTIRLNRGELVLLAVMLLIIAYAICMIALQVIHMLTPSHPTTMVVIIPPQVSLIAP
jgi:hypothetical protein